MRTHVFQASGMKDVYGRSICGVCDCIRKHRVHDVPERSEEERAVGARIVGETPENVAP